MYDQHAGGDMQPLELGHVWGRIAPCGYKQATNRV